jgi:hypothetical protein
MIEERCHDGDYNAGTVKRFVFAFLVACGGPGRVPEVSLALPQPVDSATHAPATLLGCTIVGTGERRREGEEEYPFRVFDSNEARLPVFVIAHPEVAHVTWHFPERANHGRARVGLGGQSHVRYEGYADLYGRTFTTTTRMDSVADHLWAHAGSPIDVMSATQGGEIFAQVATPFRAPRMLVVQGNCASVVYTPAFPHFDRKDRSIKLVSDAPTFRLFASPSSPRAFTTLTPEQPVFFDVVDRSGDFVHVTGDEGNVGFDAWVLASETREFSGGGRVHHYHRNSPPTVRLDGKKAARVARDTPLYAGDPPLAVDSAWIEKGAHVVYDPNAATLGDGRKVVPFDFEDLFIVAPEGSRLWIAEDVVSSWQ